MEACIVVLSHRSESGCDVPKNNGPIMDDAIKKIEVNDGISKPDLTGGIRFGKKHAVIGVCGDSESSGFGFKLY